MNVVALVLAILLAGCAAVNVTPGVLPAPSDRFVKHGRTIGGVGLLIIAIAEASVWWRGADAPPMLQFGLAVFGVGMALTLSAIVRQPCPPKD